MATILTKELVLSGVILSGRHEDGWTHEAQFRAHEGEVLVKTFSEDRSSGGIAGVPVEIFLKNYQDVNWERK